MDELEFTLLIQGEEVEALEFFYTTWAEADNMDVPAEVPDVPRELVSLVESSTSLVARYRGEMVAQMLGEVHKKDEVVGRKLATSVIVLSGRFANPSSRHFVFAYAPA